MPRKGKSWSVFSGVGDPYRNVTDICFGLFFTEDIPAAKRTRVEDKGDENPLTKAVLAYICRLQPKQGMLLAQKCVDLGVPPGPLYGQLKNGQDVTLPDGKTILASDVRSPDDPGPLFLVVECPDESFLDNFVSEPQLRKFQKSNEANELDSPQIIVHFTPIEVRFFRRHFIVDVIQPFSSFS